MMKVTCPHLSRFPSITHAFFEANPAFHPSQTTVSLNNHALSLITLTQIHGNCAHPITTLPKEKYEGDGLVTAHKGLALGILTADCGPVLFYDPEVEVIGACHAGWRGAKAGILQATLEAMEDLGADRSRIHASLGPTIQRHNYEVGPEFPDIIGEAYETYFTPGEKAGHHYFDLPQYICSQLSKEGLCHIEDVKCDTFTGNFYSRRRFLAQGDEKTKSSNLSMIAIV